MNRDEAVAYLQGAVRFGINPSLEGITALAASLGDPQGRFDVIQVAGTNGKGSTSRLVAALLCRAGLSVGLFTSPNLYEYEEQFEIDGCMVDSSDFAAAVTRVAAAASVVEMDREQALTEFELATAVALQLFSEQRIQVAVLEVGLGGRWDATSVAQAKVAVLTSLGHDHMAQLGPDLASIAAEKASIIRSGSSVVVGPGFSAGTDAVRERVRDRAAHVVTVSEGGPVDSGHAMRATEPEGGQPRRFSVSTSRCRYGQLAIAGAPYQRDNATTAIVAAEEYLDMPLDVDAVRDVLGTFAPAARFELFKCRLPVVVDGAHNDDAAMALAAGIREHFGSNKPLLVLAMLSDKDAGGVLAALNDAVSGVVVTEPESPRRMRAAELLRQCESVFGPDRCQVAPSVEAAVDTALDSAAAGVVVAGSLVTAAQARTHLSPSERHSGAR